MRLNGLRLTNFRQHARTEIEFDSGLTGIIGPNGAGKTTILEAIAYALYGNPAARGVKETIRFQNPGALASVCVELAFDLSGHRYRVVRGLTSAELFLDGAESPIANTISGVTELLQRRLGMTRAEFFHTYFTGQKELSVMAAMTPLQRGQFLSRVLGYEKLRVAQDLARDRRRVVSSQIAGLKAGMPDADIVTRQLVDATARTGAAERTAAGAAERRRAADASLEQITPRWASAQAQREEARTLQNEISLSEQTLAALTRDLERIDAELAEVAAARAEIAQIQHAVEPMEALNVELHVLDTLYREDGRRRALVESESALSADLSRLRERLAAIDSSPEVEAELAAQLARGKTELAELEERGGALRTAWIRDRQEVETKLESLRRLWVEVREQKTRIVALGEDGECPTCSRPLGESMHTVIEHLEEQFESLKSDGEYFKKREAQLADEPEELQNTDARRKELSQLTTALERKLAKAQLAAQELAAVKRDIEAKEARCAAVTADIAKIPRGYDENRHRFVRTEIARLTPLEARCQRLGALAEREPQLQQDRERTIASVTVVTGTLETTRSRVGALGFSETEFEDMRAEHLRVSTEAHAAQLALVSADADARAAREALAAATAAREDLARSEAELLRLNTDRRTHEELDRAFSDLRTDLNAQLRPELSELASSFLTDLTEARYSELDLDDDYNIQILEDGVTKPILSGGEEDLANLVLRLAISQMIAERAGQAFSLLILDEVFGSLDESRRLGVIELLRGLHDRFEQVILITHIDSVREGLDQVIAVKYDPETGASIVEQSDGGAGGGDQAEIALALEGAGV